MSARTVTLLDAATWTATAQGSPIPVPTVSMADVVVKIGTVSGTFTAFALFLEGSADGGTTWYEIPNDVNLAKAGAAAQNTAGTVERDIVNDTTPTSGDIHVGHYKHLPAPLVRISGFITGSTPSAVITAILVGK